MPAFLVAIIVVAAVAPVFAQNLSVRVVNREDNETDYTYVVPGDSSSNADTNVNCYGESNNVNCNASTRTTGSSTLAQQVSYHVRGATFSLQLPDGRVAVVNCESKFAEHMAGPAGNHRSCRMPLVDDIEVEFDGNKAKLKWPVSIDGKKMASEAYKILGVLGK
jgi:hypothetical protein